MRSLLIRLSPDLLVKSGGLLIALLFSSISSASPGLRGELLGFKLATCGVEHCIVITADRAFSGLLNSSYAFDSALIEITDRKTSHVTRIQSNDAFYDSDSKKLFLRKLLQTTSSEAIYDLENESLTYF